MRTEGAARLAAQWRDKALTAARHPSTRYPAIGAEMAIGILLVHAPTFSEGA
jgi:hypothetical protein